MVDSGAGRELDRYHSAAELLRHAIAAHAFPGAACAIEYRGETTLFAVGRYTYEASALTVGAETVYDLASVSKVAATTPVAMLLYDRSRLDLDAPVASVVPEFCGRSQSRSEAGSGNPGFRRQAIDRAPRDARRERVTFRMLLAHSSGLPAYVRLFEQAKTGDELLTLAFSTPLDHDPGTHTEYSDIGFIILGVALQRLAGESLNQFCEREVFQPLGMAATRFCPPPEWKSRIAPTADDQKFRHRIIQGEVQDENAWVMGGVAGHAGVFSTATDVSKLARCMLNGGVPLFRPDTVKLFTARQYQPEGTSRALGWDTPSSPSQSGHFFSARSFGHLGYTGTSLWVDPERELAVTLLTNRTWPDCSSQTVKQVRPKFHDAIVEALSGPAS